MYMTVDKPLFILIFSPRFWALQGSADPPFPLGWNQVSRAIAVDGALLKAFASVHIINGPVATLFAEFLNGFCTWDGLCEVGVVANRGWAYVGGMAIWRFAATVFFVILSTACAAADEACPAGPFDTDPARIKTELAALPSLVPHPAAGRDAFEAAANSNVSQGFYEAGAGGLMAVPGTGGWTSYDARRFVIVSGWFQSGDVSSVARVYRGSHLGKAVVVARARRHLVSITVTVRPTAEQAVQMACLANQLLDSTPEPTAAFGNAPPDFDELMPVRVTAREMGRCADPDFTDGHFEVYQLLSGAAGYQAPSHRYTCLQRADIQRQLEQMAASAASP